MITASMVCLVRLCSVALVDVVEGRQHCHNTISHNRKEVRELRFQISPLLFEVRVAHKSDSNGLTQKKNPKCASMLGGFARRLFGVGGWGTLENEG